MEDMDDLDALLAEIDDDVTDIFEDVIIQSSSSKVTIEETYEVVDSIEDEVDESTSDIADIFGDIASDSDDFSFTDDLDDSLLSDTAPGDDLDDIISVGAPAQSSSEINIVDICDDNDIDTGTSLDEEPIDEGEFSLDSIHIDDIDDEADRISEIHIADDASDMGSSGGFDLSGIDDILSFDEDTSSTDDDSMGILDAGDIDDSFSFDDDSGPMGILDAGDIDDDSMGILDAGGETPSSDNSWDDLDDNLSF